MGPGPSRKRQAVNCSVWCGKYSEVYSTADNCRMSVNNRRCWPTASEAEKIKEALYVSKEHGDDETDAAPLGRPRARMRTLGKVPPDEVEQLAKVRVTDAAPDSCSDGDWGTSDVAPLAIIAPGRRPQAATVPPPAARRKPSTLPLAGGEASRRAVDSRPRSSSGAAISSRAQLTVSNLSGEALRVVALVEAQQIIGRGEDVHVSLDHGTVSRVHAQLVRGPFGHWWIHDLASTNGTYVNGSRVQERLLSPGDAIGIGDYTLILDGVPAELPEPAASEAVDGDKQVLQWHGTPRDPHRTLLMAAEPMRDRKVGASHLASLMNLSRELLRIESAPGRKAHTCRYMVGRAFPANHATVVRLRSGGRDCQVLVGPMTRRGCDEQMSPLSHSVADAVLATRKPVFASNIGTADSRAEGHGLDLTMSKEIREVTIIACPLQEREGEVQCLYLEFPSDYATSEWLTLVTFVGEIAAQADSVWEMRENVRHSASLESELEMARQIQDGLVPRDLETMAPVAVAIGYQPCRWVGGDYVDVIERQDGRLLLAIADVCGKGMQAALVASSLHTLVRATADSNLSLPKLMERFNGYFCRYLPDHSFVTMLTVLLDPASGAIELVNAGHPPAIVVNRYGHSRTLQSEENLPLGLIDTEMRSSREDLAPGEALLMYTDGLSEANDEQGRPLGEVGLAAGLGGILANRPNVPIQQLCDLFAQRVESFTKGEVAKDDRTFLMARRR